MNSMRVLDLLWLLSIISISYAARPGCVTLYEHCNYRGKNKY